MIVLINEIYTLINNKSDNYIWNYIHKVNKDDKLNKTEKNKLIFNIVKNNYGIIGVLYPIFYFFWILFNIFSNIWFIGLTLLILNVIFHRCTEFIIKRYNSLPYQYHFVVKLIYSIIYIISGVYFFNSYYHFMNLPMF